MFFVGGVEFDGGVSLFSVLFWIWVWLMRFPKGGNNVGEFIYFVIFGFFADKCFTRWSQWKMGIPYWLPVVNTGLAIVIGSIS